MNKDSYDMPQGSPEWHAIRLGRLTASRISDMMAKTKTGWGASRDNYAAELVAERLTGNAAEKFTNSAMQWGTDNEAAARANYQFLTDVDIVEIGFVSHPSISMAGASPDGLVGDHGLVEIKCPNTATHIETLQSGEIAKKYILQMQWQLACTGRKYCDFVSFDPRMPENMQLFIKRVARDDILIAELEREAVTFLAQIKKTCTELTQRYGSGRAA